MFGSLVILDITETKVAVNMLVKTYQQCDVSISVCLHMSLFLSHYITKQLLELERKQETVGYIKFGFHLKVH
jgi:hypothetical protein